MSTLKRTQTRHRMLGTLATGEAFLECVNLRQAVWVPRRLLHSGNAVGYRPAESRAIGDFLFEYAHTPDWQGDMDVLRDIELTAAGRELLSQWDKQYGEVKP